MRQLYVCDGLIHQGNRCEQCEPINASVAVQRFRADRDAEIALAHKRARNKLRAMRESRL